MTAPTLSIVIPCRNEQANIEAISAAVIAEVEPLGETFELILIDNASTDETVALARALCARDPRIKLIVNVRNFGQMRSPTHGIYQASGRAVISLCADFQDPPELIPGFVERWRAGTDIVLGVRETERSSWPLMIAREAGYAFLRRFGDYPVIRNATGFGLYDARVVRTLKALNEPEPFFRGMLVESGYSIETISYRRPVRQAGKSNNNLLTLIDFALSGLAGSSKKLLRMPSYLGLIALAAAALCLPIALISAVIGGGWLGWLIAAAVEAQIGLIFLSLGLIGDQVRLTAERTRGTPLVIERERINFADGD